MPIPVISGTVSHIHWTGHGRRLRYILRVENTELIFSVRTVLAISPGDRVTAAVQHTGQRPRALAIRNDMTGTTVTAEDYVGQDRTGCLLLLLMAALATGLAMAAFGNNAGYLLLILLAGAIASLAVVARRKRSEIMQALDCVPDQGPADTDFR